MRELARAIGRDVLRLSGVRVPGKVLGLRAAGVASTSTVTSVVTVTGTTALVAVVALPG